MKHHFIASSLYFVLPLNICDFTSLNSLACPGIPNLNDGTRQQFVSKIIPSYLREDLGSGLSLSNPITGNFLAAIS